MTKVLFVLKKRENSWGSDNYSGDFSSGLMNSATFVSEMLISQKFDSKIVNVEDGNRIDKEVFLFKPNFVIIEAFWVTPEKLAELTRLYPRIVWVVRNHSEVPFLSNEGIAFEWILKYSNIQNVRIASNSERAVANLRDLLRTKLPGIKEYDLTQKTPYLPNFYALTGFGGKPNIFDDTKDHIDIACFGAIRPLKNHVVQAVAAIKFAKILGKKLKFHVNGGRIEGKGEPILKNLENIFANDSRCELVKHEWLPHDTFISVIKTMDMGMQVSFSETFNIVTADFVASHIPVVVSKEISWINSSYQADPTNIDDIVNRMHVAKHDAMGFFFKHLNIHGLEKYNSSSIHYWNYFLKSVNF